MSIESRALSSEDDLIRVEEMTHEFGHGRGKVLACDRMTLRVGRRVSLGLVGESGSGKSTAIRLMQRFMRPTQGKIFWQGVEVTRVPERNLKRYRKKMGFVAQDPYGSLFPNRTVVGNVIEPLIIHGTGANPQRMRRAKELLDRVGIAQGHQYIFPHELSGGQQQRVAIARALALGPDLLMLDEAVSSLDVSIQAQIINLLQDLKVDLDLTYVFVSHNLAVVRLLCETVAVMYLGRVVEMGETQKIFDNPYHPYTKMLIQSIPRLTENGVSTLPVPSQPALVGADLDTGCAYAPRCPLAMQRCLSQPPELRRQADGTEVACHAVP